MSMEIHFPRKKRVDRRGLGTKTGASGVRMVGAGNGDSIGVFD